MTIGDAYKALGIVEGATPDEVKRAYRIMCHKHHPDKGGSEDLFKLVAEAYDVLRRFASSGTKQTMYEGFRGQRGASDSSVHATDDVTDADLWSELSYRERMYKEQMDTLMKAIVKQYRAEAHSRGLRIRNIYIDDGDVKVEYWDDTKVEGRKKGL